MKAISGCPGRLAWSRYPRHPSAHNAWRKVISGFVFFFRIRAMTRERVADEYRSILQSLPPRRVRIPIRPLVFFGRALCQTPTENSMAITYSDADAVKALLNVIGESKWEAVALARGFQASREGATLETAAHLIFEHGPQTLKRSKELLEQAKTTGFTALLTPRTRTGSAENPITKMFPATITEQRFLELLDELHARRPSVTYKDDRASGHGLTDFTLVEDDLTLPINIKNAGTRFERAMDLVRLDPDDCIPIPSYKAHAAVEAQPTLLYVVAVDYALIGELKRSLPTLLTREEQIVWDLLNRYQGTQLRHAEDTFIFTAVRTHWDDLKPLAQIAPFNVISARKAIRILQTKPYRTPGIGLRAWGSGASAEVNVHVSIKDDMTPWKTVCDRIIVNGIIDVVRAVNRKRVEEVYDPEI